VAGVGQRQARAADRAVSEVIAAAGQADAVGIPNQHA
jgi:hypothetical protein